MNAVLEQMHRHRSVRKFKKDPVPDEVLEHILQAGIRASSSGNMQAYSIVVTSDPKLKKALHEPHFGQSMATEAPLLLTFCADFHRMRLWLEKSEAPENFDNLMSFMIAAIDATLVSQNVALAAESMGLGICFMGTTLASCREIAKILRCPGHTLPVVGFALGYPAEEGPLRDRLPLEGLVHRETYQDYRPETLASVYAARETAGWNRYMEIPELKKMAEENGAKNLAQVYTKVKYTKASHEEYSRTVYRCLEEQGFRPSLD